MPSLEERVQRLEDLEAIRALKIRYAGLCDDAYNPEGLAALFAGDAVWDGTPHLGRFEGRAAIRAYFAGASAEVTFALHYTLGHLIDVEVSGTRATGTWYLLMPGTVLGRRAVWVGGTYRDVYVKQDGHWLFQDVRLHLDFITPYEKGWVTKPFAGQ